MIPIDIVLRHPMGKPVLADGVAAGRAKVSILPDAFTAGESSLYSALYKLTMKDGVAPVRVGTVLDIEGTRYQVARPPVKVSGGGLVCMCIEAPQ